MRVMVNGHKETLTGATTIAGLLTHLNCSDHKIAVEVNRALVPRSEHADYVLSEGDTVEIVHAVGGG